MYSRTEGAQSGSIAVDEKSGNVFVAGRERRKLGFCLGSSGTLGMLDWLETEEEIINLDATPPQPIRKVVADRADGSRQVIAG